MIRLDGILLHAVRRFCDASSRQTLLAAALFLFGGSGALHAQVFADRCADRNPTGAFECSYRPKKVEDWKYYIPGPIKAVGPFMKDEAAIKAYEAVLAENCPNCCDPGRIVNQAGWVDNTGGFWTDVPQSSSAAITISRSARYGDGTCAPVSTYTTIVHRSREVGCEPWSMSQDTGPRVCYRYQRPERECQTPHPISIPSMAKVFTEADYGPHAMSELKFTRDYRSDGFSRPELHNPWTGMGHSWTHNYEGHLWEGATSVAVALGSGVPQYFIPGGGLYPAQLAPLRGGQQTKLVKVSATRYFYYAQDNRVIVFDAGRPVEMIKATGLGVTLIYAGPLTAAEDSFGRRVGFTYDGQLHISSLVDPAGESVVYGYKPLPKDKDGYDSGGYAYTNLRRLTFQDGSYREYVTPDWIPGGSSPDQFAATFITGVVDEHGVRFKSIAYNTSTGTVLSSELAGGVERYSVNAGNITDPLGAARNYTSGAAFSSPFNNVSGIYQPAGAGCTASSAQYEFDNQTGLFTSRTDFSGLKTCYAYAPSARSLEAVRVEGLNQYAACPSVVGVGVSLPANSRKVSSEWHPDWRLATKVAEPGRITTSVYNGQPDPFAGNAIASCAPSTALLPDGKPIVVLCKQVEQATTDANGAAGFSAGLQSGVPNRVTTWTYNQWGQVLTENGPRTDVNDTTTYTYYSDTSFTGEGAAAQGHFMGDLQSVTNAAGRVTQYSKYNRHGQLLESTDPNGVLTVNTYDLRQRLLSTSVGGQTTSYTYDPVGQLKRVTLPDTSWVAYDYDDAHRQVAVYDNKGNRTEYLLDNAGNRIGETTRDPGGALKRQLSRSIDALGRVQQTTGRE